MSTTSTPSDFGQVAEETVGQDTAIDEVARLLEGRRMVFIGGECRSQRKAALERAFQLSELIWIEANPGKSFADCEPAIAKADVAVVLLAIRWVSHSFANVRQLCETHGRPLVRLPGGYSPNQIAANILAQCSERLSLQNNLHDKGN
jgi:hypothetical protein